MNHPRVHVDRVWAMSREREQMFSLVCSPGLLATLAGHWTGAGEVTPSRRLWTSYQSSDLRFFPVSAVWPSGRFSTSHARLQPLPLSKGNPPPRQSQRGATHQDSRPHCRSGRSKFVPYCEIPSGQGHVPQRRSVQGLAAIPGSGVP